MGVYDDDAYPFLEPERALVRAVHGEGAVLGICLGAQQLAAALDAPVGPHGDAEIGWFPVEATEAAADSPLAPLGDDYVPLHWHGDSFAVPDGATLLATSEACHTQAFAIERSLGLQYHLEVTPEDVAAYVEATGDWPEGPWVQSPLTIIDGGDYDRLHDGLYAALDWLVEGC
jgi:GMP synthase-like glutamine amidotransferase